MPLELDIWAASTQRNLPFITSGLGFTNKISSTHNHLCLTVHAPKFRCSVTSSVYSLLLPNRQKAMTVRASNANGSRRPAFYREILPRRPCAAESHNLRILKWKALSRAFHNIHAGCIGLNQFFLLQNSSAFNKLLV